MTTIKLRRGTAAEWTTANPILAAGEMGIETDTRKFKFGDGTTPWNTLDYASAEGGGGTGDVTTAGNNTFTGNNIFTGTTKFDNDVNIHGGNLEVTGAIEAATGNITNLQVPNTLTSSGEINAVSIKSTGIRSDDIQTTANKKYLTEVDVDNQTIQMVDGKLHANLDNVTEQIQILKGTKQDKLTAGDGIDIRKTLDGAMNYDWYLNDVSLNPVPSTISSPAKGITNIYKPYNNQVFSNTANEINITFDVLYADTSSATGSYIKATGTNGEINISFDGGYRGGDSTFGILCTINSSTIINVGDIKIPYHPGTYLRYMFTFNRTTKIWSITVKDASNNIEIYSNSGSTSIDIIPTDSLITIGMGNINGFKNGITVKTDTFSVSSSLEEITQISANLDELNNEVNNLSGRVTANEADIQTKQDILADGNGTKVGDNKVDIYQGNAGINGLTLYQNNGTITKNNDLSITFNNGACGYIYFPNKGVNNNYEVVLHCTYNGTHGSRDDSDIHGIRVQPTTSFPNELIFNGFSWVDIWSSPFRAIIVNKDSTQDYSVIIPTANYIKYTIIGTKIRQYYSTDGVDYTSITYNNNLDYVEISETEAYLNLCIANRNSINEIGDCWTNTTLFSDSYVLDKTTNTYLMKQGIANEGVAVATSTKYGLVLPDNSTIVSTNGVISANLPDTSKFLDKTLYSNQTMNGSLTVNGGVTECQKFRMRSSGTGSIDYANTTLGKTMFVFRGVNGNYPILIGDSNQNIQIDSTKVLFNSPTLARKVDDSTEATIVDSSNVSTYATGLAFPSNRYIDLTPGANGTKYIAPADGWIAFAKKLTATGQYVCLSNNTTYISNMGCNAADGSGSNTSCFIPCKKGDEVVTWYSAGGDVLTLRFIYAEGVQ